MSMRKRTRTRPSVIPDYDEDELSPSKPTPAPLSAVKKRKLNTYGSPINRGSMFGKLSEVFGFRRLGGEKENIGATEEKDELAGEEGEGEGGKEEEDIWEVPDEEETKKSARAGRGKGTLSTKGKGTPISRGKTGSLHNGRIELTKGDIYEVEDSEEDVNVSTSARSKRCADRTLSIPMSTRASKKEPEEEEENITSKRPRGRPPKQAEAVATSPRPSAGKPRARDILKKAKKLSREAIFQQMVEEGRKNAKKSEEAQTSSRTRSGRSNAEVEVEEDEDKVEDDKTTIPVRRGRPKKATIRSIKEVPKGILTPTKDRTLKLRKSVAFESCDDIDLGFKDLPNKTSTSKKGRKPSLLSHDDPEEPTSKVPEEGRKLADSVEESSQAEEEESEGTDDDEACEVCKGLNSEKGNFIIFCENCNFAVHQKCYDTPKVPKGDWFCRDCQADNNKDTLALRMADDVTISEPFNDLPEIDGFEDNLRHMQRVLLNRLTGRKPVSIRGHDEEVRKVHQVIEQTVLAGEGNSMLVIGARGCGKTTLVESVISNLSLDHREKFHVVRLNGFIHTDDRLALKEIWRQLGREMDAEDEMGGKTNHADTLASLLALLSHPSEISKGRADETAKSVVFILDEFDLFTAHPRQTLLYNLFDIAQARKAPIIVLGLTTRINVVETLEKRVKSRFSHRYVHLSLPRSLPSFWEICKEGLLVENKDLESEGFDLGISGQDEFIYFWQSMIDDLYNNDATFKHHLQSHFFRSKSVPAFFASCILPIANLSARNLPLTGRKFMSSTISLSAPDSKLHILQGLSELELALLIAAARLDIILDTDTCNFAMAYDEYSSLTSRHKIQTSSAGIVALGASAKVWGRDVALGAWERLAEYELLVPAGIGGGSARDFGAGGRMWKVDVALEEIAGSVESLSGVMAKWCREI